MAINLLKTIITNTISTVGSNNELSYIKALSTFEAKINEVITKVNNIDEYVNKLLTKGIEQNVTNVLYNMLNNGELDDLINTDIIGENTVKIQELQNTLENLKNELKNVEGTLNIKIDNNSNNIKLNTESINKIYVQIDDLIQRLQDKNTNTDNNNNNSGGDNNMNQITTRFAIDAGHDIAWDGGCSWVTGGNEAGHTRELADKVIELLTTNGCINVFDVQKNSTGTNTVDNLRSRTSIVNNWNADYCISLHFNSNAGTPATGTETYIIAKGGKAEALANKVNNAICEKIGTVNRGVKVGNLAMVRDTNCPAVLIEVCFANNINDVNKYDVNKVAEAIVSVLLDKSISSSIDSSTGTNTSTNYLKGKVDKEGLKLIKSWEAFGRTGYKDSLGFTTIGFGTTQKWQPTAYNMMLPAPTTEQKATEALVYTLENDYAKALYNYISSKGKIGSLNQNRFNALVSLAYNKGTNALIQSELLNTILNNPNSSSIENLFINYQVLAGTSANTGLINRRKSEYQLYLGNKCTRAISIYEGTKNTGEIVTSNSGYGYIPQGY